MEARLKVRNVAFDSCCRSSRWLKIANFSCVTTLPLRDDPNEISQV